MRRDRGDACRYGEQIAVAQGKAIDKRRKQKECPLVNPKG